MRDSPMMFMSSKMVCVSEKPLLVDLKEFG